MTQCHSAKRGKLQFPFSGETTPEVVLVVAGALLLLSAAAAQVRDVPAAPQKGTGAIEVRVELLDAGRREPLRRAAVELRTANGQLVRSGVSDGAGHLRFDELVNDPYRVLVAKPGFTRLSPSENVELDRDNRATVAIEMQRAAALEGRFVDDRGLPIEALRVTADPAAAGGPEKSSWATTDDLGRFRIHTLPPGKYRVRASPPSLSGTGSELFYPGTTNPSEASVLSIEAGQTVGGLNFTVASVSPLPEVIAASAEVERQINSPESPGLDGRILGRVTRGDVGLPIASATVNLLSSTNILLRSVSSDGDGRFLFPRLPEGRYSVTVNAQGFLSQKVQGATGSRSPTIEIFKGSTVRVDPALLPACAIEVQIVDEFGDPAPGVVVRVVSSAPTAGIAPGIAPGLIAAAGTTNTGTTDDRGWFRAFQLPPGDYQVSAVPEPFARSGPAAFALTYFPGTPTADPASAVRLGGGIEFRQLAFNLLSTRTGTLRGVTLADDGAPVPAARLALVPMLGSSIPDSVFLTTTTAGDGSFVFRNVPQGSYVIQGVTGLRYGTMSVTAAFPPEADNSPIVFTLLPLRTARGRIIFEGDSQPQETDRFVVNVRPTEPALRVATVGTISTVPLESGSTVTGPPDWMFQVRGLSFRGVVGLYGVSSARPGSAWVVTRVMLRGRNITDEAYDFQAEDVDGLEVVVTDRVGAVTGTVTDAGSAAASVNVMVFGAENSSPNYLSRTTKTVQTDGKGAFQVTALLPGRYFVAATRAGVAPPNRDELRTRATLINVTVGGRAEVSLTVVK